MTRQKDELINSIWDKLEADIEAVQNEVYYVHEENLPFYHAASHAIDDLFEILNNNI